MRPGSMIAAALSSALALLVAVPSALAADPPPPAAQAAQTTPAMDLEQAETAYANLDFDSAGKAVRHALDQHGLTHDQLVRGYRILARVDAILDRPDESRAAYVTLLTLSPDEKEDKNLPPKMTDRMAEARGVLSGYTARPGIEANPVLRQREAGAVRIALHDPRHVAKHVALAYRWGGDVPFATVTTAAADSLSVEVPPPPPGVSRFDFYAQALDDHDSVFFETGTADLPKTTSLALAEITPPPPRPVPHPPPPPIAPHTEGRSIFASPVFWAVTVGTIVVGSVIVFAATRPGSPTSVSLSPTLDCGSTRCN